MRSFNDIYQTASLHCGGTKSLESRLPTHLTYAELAALDDRFFLSMMSRRIFRAGLKHSMVDAKWSNFDIAFQHFDPFFCAMLSDDDFDFHMKNTSLIRHRGKLLSIRHNAQFVMEASKEAGGFGRYLASWQAEQTVELWWTLKKRGKQLGGNSGPNFLRMAGKDTFLLTRDVVAVLKNEAVIDREPTSKKDMLACQDAFMQWQVESGRPLCEISRIVSHTATL